MTLVITTHKNKAAAKKHIMTQRGIFKIVDTCESGDHGYGSRVYYENEHGDILSASKVGNAWKVSNALCPNT